LWPGSRSTIRLVRHFEEQEGVKTSQSTSYAETVPADESVWAGASQVFQSIISATDRKRTSINCTPTCRKRACNLLNGHLATDVQSSMGYASRADSTSRAKSSLYASLAPNQKSRKHAHSIWAEMFLLSISHSSSLTRPSRC